MLGTSLEGSYYTPAPGAKITVAAGNRRPRVFDLGLRRGFGGCLAGGTREPSAEGAGHRGIRIALPSDDTFRAVNEERGEATDAVAQEPPEAEQGLGIQDADDDPALVCPLHLLDPGGQAKVFRLDVLGVLVDLLCVDLLPDPRSIQERLAVGSVVESGKNGCYHLDQDRLSSLHVYPSLIPAEAARTRTRRGRGRRPLSATACPRPPGPTRCTSPVLSGRRRDSDESSAGEISTGPWVCGDR